MFSRAVLRTALRAMLLVLAGARSWGRRRARAEGEREAALDILLTGTFHSDNWVGAHLRPLAASGRCQRVRVVSVYPVPPIDGVEVIHPPRWLQRLVGEVPARLLSFVWEALRRRPDWIGGFHLLINGLVAGALARLVGSRSLYFCVGGPAEVVDGGLLGENRLFSRLEVPDPVIERRLLDAVGDFDLVITMGEGARRFFVERTTARAVHVHGGGIDGMRFHPGQEEPEVDVIFVGRLAPIKRLDVFLRAVAQVAEVRPTTTALVVGDGPLRAELEALARQLGIEARVRFLGHRSDVEAQLRRGRVFMLTSQTEGLALSVMEAMMSGLAAVVPAVGDLADLVKDGVNGFVVKGSGPEDFAAALLQLLEAPTRLASFRHNALQAVQRCELRAAVRAWDTILAEPEPRR